jgi:hypothetical protein
MVERRTNIFNMDDLEEMGIEKVGMALERAWGGCDAVYLSYDIDLIEAGFVPGAILAMMQKHKKVGGHPNLSLLKTNYILIL